MLPIIASPPPPPRSAPPPSGQPSRRRNPASPQNPPPAALKCPRCDSTNTKFCYYNNYSLAQPRYFCKACHRYWTHGGALRHVPFGGGCRRNKRPRNAVEAPAPPINPLPNLRLPTLPSPNLTPAAGTLRFSGGIGSPAVLSFTSPFNFPGNQINLIAGDNGGASLPPPISSVNVELQWNLHLKMAKKLHPGFFENAPEVPGAMNPRHYSGVASGSGGGSAPAAAGSDWSFAGGGIGGNEDKENGAVGLNDGDANEGWGDNQYQDINGMA